MRMHGCGPRRPFDKRAMAAMIFSNRSGSWGPFSWDLEFGDSNFRGRRGPRGRNRMFGSGELRLALLGLIANTPRHGYELIKAIEDLSGGKYAPSPGVVYPTLNLLVDEGLISEQDGSGTRKSFAATEAGQAELDERREEYEAIIARLSDLAEREDRQAAPPLKRAMGNLFTAVSQRASSGDLDRDTIHSIAEILDDAARRIERL